MDGELTIEELSARVGEPADELRRWQSLSLIGAGERETFGDDDVRRAKFVRLLLRRGVALEAIAKAERRSAFLAREVDRLFPRREGPLYSLEEAAERAGLPLDVARRVWQAGGLAADDEALDEADAATLDGVRRALDAGFPEEALLQMFRVFADSLDRVAEAASRAFHFYVHEPLRASASSAEEARGPLQAITVQVVPLIEPMILYFFRRGQEKARRDDAVLHVAEEAGLTRITETRGRLRVAIVFADLASFTPLTDAMGDREAAAVLERFSELVRQSASHWDGRVVKQIGDAFMLTFSGARQAVSCAVEIEARASEERQFPAARAGAHWGDVLYRDGDYVGKNVNIASRVAEEGERHQVLVTAAARKQAGSVPGIKFVRLGRRRLRGLADEQDLFEARFAAAERREKSVDPVCGMELGPDEAAATLTLEGRVRTFCSDECLRRFVAAPEGYAS